MCIPRTSKRMQIGSLLQHMDILINHQNSILRFEDDNANKNIFNNDKKKCTVSTRMPSLFFSSFLLVSYARIEKEKN
jgi:hypothetical protein